MLSFYTYSEAKESIVTNSQPQATPNPVGGKACSSTKDGLLRYILNTYSIHKVSSLKFAYFQGRLSHHSIYILIIYIFLNLPFTDFKIFMACFYQ